ncbi:putative bifunctional diguanylate cyclase/phosphodiesterase [Microvirga sp. CF3016]|uniref:putative bifunctional diguanylate cyclase/phosphodiesterase n=1 Tax=Microvirga sp. CF3016 TaxID=3110181 RepID=UPI002E78ADB9|nr:EAL domain-containing protein [Microvirga sp. CF3016]MEE1613721.1 EAL domain-containing protein [Microvirga sp. CF3016]
MAVILILDDKSTNRNIYSRLAQKIEDGAVVHAFASPVEALEWLQGNAPDLIVTDFRMPGMDGAEFTKHVRASTNGIDVPIIVITAYDDRAFRLRALEAGATDFLRSPVDHYEFVTRARNLLKLQRQQQQIKGRAQALEQQLRISERSQEELVRSSREALAQVIDTVPALISAADKDSRIVFVNAHFADFVNSTPESLTGKLLSDVLRSNKPEFSRQVHRSIVTDQRSSVSFEESVTDPAGAQRVFLTTKTSMRAFSGTETSVLTTSVDITERKQAESTLRHIALHDTLTDLPNRRMLYDWIQQELSSAQTQFAILLIDLDRFKAVNDAFGHAGGDRMLQLVTSRLLGTVSSDDLVARMSGDEFVVVQANIKSPDGAEDLARKIINSLSAPFLLEETEIRIGCTIGITLAPRDSQDAEKLLRYADLSMYRAKAEGRNTLRFYSSEMDSISWNNIGLETDLRKAVVQEQFELHYQPQINLETGSIAGAEALLRWNRPEFGLTAPNAFIDIAEETGLINEIGAWVLKQACAQAVAWQSLGHGPIGISVNLSPVQFLRQDIVQLVDDALKVTGLNPEFLELELTEGSLLKDVERTKEVLQRLKKIGVRIAIDDFGVGFSSLSYLKNFAVDTLKIDRSFISSLLAGSRDEAIVRTIISLAQSLELKVVAEGVETNPQLACLLNYDCDEAQGYLFSRPVPSDVFETLLRENPRYLLPKQNVTPKKVHSS